MGDGSGSTGEGGGMENSLVRAWSVGGTDKSGLDWFGLSLQWMTDDVRSSVVWERWVVCWVRVFWSDERMDQECTLQALRW